MSRESKIEQIRKESLRCLNEERLKRAHKDYKKKPLIENKHTKMNREQNLKNIVAESYKARHNALNEAEKNTPIAPGAAGAVSGGGSGLNLNKWPGVWSAQYEGPGAANNACDEADKDHEYFSDSGVPFTDEAVFSDAQGFNELLNGVYVSDGFNRAQYNRDPAPHWSDEFNCL